MRELTELEQQKIATLQQDYATKIAAIVGKRATEFLQARDSALRPEQFVFVDLEYCIKMSVETILELPETVTPLPLVYLAPGEK